MFIVNHARRVRRLAAALAIGATVGLAGPAASAGTSTVDFSSSTSVKGRGAFQGSATLDGDLLTVDLTNTSSRGYLDGVAFDTAGGKAADMTADGKKGFRAAAGKHGLSVKPFGRYQDAVMVKGSARHGIAAGATKTFVFKVNNDAGSMSAYDLLNNAKGESIVGLFKGFRHGGKDRAGGAVVLRLTSSSLTDGSAGGSTPGSSGTGGATGTSGGPPSLIVPPTIVTSGPGGAGKPVGGTGGLPGSTGLPGAGDPAPAAVPLPPAAWTGFGTLGLMAIAAMKRRSVKALV